MEQENDTQTTLRDALEASFDAVESSEPAVEEKVDERVRDEAGRYAKALQEEAKEVVNPSPVATTHDIPEPIESILQRPTTWKKEYLPLWDKLQAGEPLTQEEATKFLQYTNQRENEYKSGVSTYKGEAENARALQEAIAPFVPDLQRYGIHPAAWINNLGRAHQTLALGNEQQRLEAFVKLAQDYQVPLQALLGGEQPDQYVTAQMQELNQLRQQVNTIASWTEQEKNQRLMSEINRVKSDVEHFPHFDQVRETMAQLLEARLAPDLESAYNKAVRMQDDVWQIEQERLLQSAKSDAAQKQHTLKAKAASVQLKSATPSAIKSADGDGKDRRSVLESAFNSFADGRV